MDSVDSILGDSLFGSVPPQGDSMHLMSYTLLLFQHKKSINVSYLLLDQAYKQAVRSRSTTPLLFPCFTARLFEVELIFVDDALTCTHPSYLTVVLYYPLYGTILA